jgi:hypothetical protein
MCYCDQTLYQNLVSKNQQINKNLPGNNQWVSSWSSRPGEQVANSFQQNPQNGFQKGYQSGFMNGQQNGHGYQNSFQYNQNQPVSADFQMVRDSQVMFQIVKSLYRYHLLTVLACLLGPLLTRKTVKILSGNTNSYKFLLTIVNAGSVVGLSVVNGAQVYCLCVLIMIQIGKALVYLVKNDSLTKTSRQISKIKVLNGFLRFMFYVSALHDVGGHRLSQICGSSIGHLEMEHQHRIFALQLLEYKSRPILLTILFSSLEFPASFVSEYMRLQPLLRVKLEKQNFMKNSNLRPDSCFEGFFKILLGFFVAVVACINDRLHGILLLAVYTFDFYEFYTNLPDNSYHVKTKTSSTSATGTCSSSSGCKSSTSRESVYCCPHKYRNQ